MKKIIFINDPVAGFIRIDNSQILDIVNHPYYQRLRRIRQLGLTEMVFPGAVHTRFQHSLGAYQLMTDVITHLRLKDVEISEQEEFALKAAILLHDIGHGPFSHALESQIVTQVNHEQISLFFMNYLNHENDGLLNDAIDIVNKKYKRNFLNQLVSGQLDIDRLDYLRRDSFFTGVPEGMAGSERLIRMMNVCNDELVIDKKGVYSVENFLMARRAMYWQVYLHKTVVAAEQMLMKVLQRAKFLTKDGNDLFASPSLKFFMSADVADFQFNNHQVLHNFALLDDIDLLQAIKVWTNHKDFILSELSKNLTERKFPVIEVTDQKIDNSFIEDLLTACSKKYKISKDDSKYFVFDGFVENTLYNNVSEKIIIRNHDGQLIEFNSKINSQSLTFNFETDQRYFLCYPKNLKNF